MSGFPHHLIRLWGVDTNTKHTLRLWDTHTTTSRYHTDTHILYIHVQYTHPLKCCRGALLRHALLRQSSSALGGPLSHSGSPQLHQSARQDRGKGRAGQKEVLEVKAFISELRFCFKSICQVKAALNRIRLFHTQVAPETDVWILFKFQKLPINFWTKFASWHVNLMSSSDMVEEKNKSGHTFSYVNEMLHVCSLFCDFGRRMNIFQKIVICIFFFFRNYANTEQYQSHSKFVLTGLSPDLRISSLFISVFLETLPAKVLKTLKLLSSTFFILSVLIPVFQTGRKQNWALRKEIQ